MSGAILPPKWALADNKGIITVPWYNFLRDLSRAVEERVRPVTLTADTQFFVRPGGSDTTGDGSVNTDAKAFATPQGAYEYIRDKVDAAGWDVTIQIANGTYTMGAHNRITGTDAGTTTCVMLMEALPPGCGGITVEGNQTTPANVIFEGAGVNIPGIGLYVRFQGITFRGDDDDQNGIFCLGSGSVVVINDCVFGEFTGTQSNHLHMYGPSALKIFGDYTITGDAGRHIWAEGGCTVDLESHTVTLTGTPAWGTAGHHTDNNSNMIFIDVVFSGGATGTKFIKKGNATLAGSSTGTPITDWNAYLPGDADGIDNSEFTGTWTPSLLFNGSSTGVTYSTRVGRYVRQGNLVTLWASFVLTSNGSGTGSAQISGIPFTVATITGYEAIGTFGGYSNISTDAIGYHCSTQSADTRIDLLGWGGAGTDASAFLTENEIDDDAKFNICISYLTTET
jgi:hypothetical protein